MSYFKFQDYQVYYEVQGEGKPILMLNGIMMSTRSWEAFMPSLSHQNQVIRVDFLDQGQSSRLEGMSYPQEIQADLVEALIQHLQLEKVNIVGISYGGEVAIQVAIKYPKLVDRLVLFNTTPYTNPWLEDIGRGWIAAGKTRNGQAYYQTTIPVIYSARFYEARIDWMKKREELLVPIFSNPVFLDAMERLTLSAEHYDVREQLKNIQAKTLIVSAEDDYLTPVDNQKQVYEQIPQAEWIKIPLAGHASMYEKPMLFTTLVVGFISTLQTEYII